MLKDWIEVWDGEQYLLININNVSVIKKFEGETTIIMNNGLCYKVKNSMQEVYDKIYDARRKGM